ncbi:MAG: hypothetical protein ACE5Q6_16425 [Dehalococcoidia bacterium]
MNIQLNFTRANASALLVGLLAIELVLAAIFVWDFILGLPHGLHILFDMDREANIPAWFASIQLLLVGALALLISRQPDRHIPTSHWFLLLVAGGFAFLSLDEMVGVHERMSSVLGGLEAVPSFSDHGVWVLPYLSVGMILGMATLKNLLAVWRHFRPEALIVLIGSVIFVSGGIGLEVASYILLRSGETPVLYQVEVLLEEFFEMAGVSVILYGALLFILRTSSPRGAQDVMGSSAN